MATAGLNKVIQHLHQALAPPGLTDKQLLARFAAARDQGAFTALVRRHGAMVLGVCRRLLRHEQDVEDAFQATFLVLARKAGSTRWADAIAPWLYEVANRTALEVNAVNARRRAREKQVENMPHPQAPPAEPQDWRPVLDEELRRLPEKYRAAVVLCELEGTTRKEAARQLGVPEGTLSSRLATARRLLAERLARRGVALPAGALLAAGGQVSAALVSCTTKAATLIAVGELAAAPTAAAALARGVMKAMLMTKLKLGVGALVAVAALGTSGLAYRAGPAPAMAQAPQNELEALRKENELLKLNLRVVLEKVRAQEAEVLALRGTVKQMTKQADQHKTRLEWHLYAQNIQLAQREWEHSLLKLKAREVAPPSAEQEMATALEALRKARDPAAKRRAADDLEKALGRLRKELK
jgi:RNA polymerase sigma factor (sigma-70 family)